jgi:hypothetical protein
MIFLPPLPLKSVLSPSIEQEEENSSKLISQNSLSTSHCLKGTPNSTPSFFDLKSENQFPLGNKRVESENSKNQKIYFLILITTKIHEEIY